MQKKWIIAIGLFGLVAEVGSIALGLGEMSYLNSDGQRGWSLGAATYELFGWDADFTPWHGVLYPGFLLLAAVLAGTFARNLLRGQNWRQAVPAGYDLALAGVALFMAGGVGDMLWHILFGIEVNIEALLSPTYLLLAVGGGLIAIGPLRAALGSSSSCCRLPSSCVTEWLRVRRRISTGASATPTVTTRRASAAGCNR